MFIRRQSSKILSYHKVEIMVGTTIMHKKTTSVAPQVEPSNLPLIENGDVSGWLINVELALEAEVDDVRREYTNIGGQNGLELFV